MNRSSSYSSGVPVCVDQKGTTEMGLVEISSEGVFVYPKSGTSTWRSVGDGICVH
jgi:predicted RecA/RadA family phage recombinase